ncbi:E7 [Human papillomavirus 186]|uniref:Protein E7 n=1 Tax=Human papillomavirus TaxID=10566 RepID=A0A385PKW9_9PAPI|nr:E7 [Human papillomavirus 186]AYA93656.1 MAG: E7 protein [Human papillomavirus]
MHGAAPQIQDIVLNNIDDLILPANLLANEDLSEEAELETCHDPYQIVTYCALCQGKLKFHITASREGILGFEQLLLGSISFVCTGCSRTARHGR